MTDAIDQTAALFQAEISDQPAPRQSSRQRQADPEEKPEPMFEHLGEFADNSEERGGGDDDPAEGFDPRDPHNADEDGEADPNADEDEDEDEEADPNADEDEDEDEGEADPELDKTFSVMVDGEEKEVTLREALEGYIRTDTFHTRLNRLNEAQQIIQTEAARVMESRAQVQQQLEDLQQQMEALIPQEPDWDKLYSEDPAKARALEKQYKDYKASIDKIKADREKVRKDALDEDARRTKEFAEAEFPKFAKIAKWKGRKDMERDIDSMRRTATNAGFTPEEYSQVYDSRMLTVLLKASKYDRMMAARPKPVNNDGKNNRKPNAKGAGSNRTAPKGIDRAQKKLARTGSVEAAADVFAQIIS